MWDSRHHRRCGLQWAAIALTLALAVISCQSSRQAQPPLPPLSTVRSPSPDTPDIPEIPQTTRNNAQHPVRSTRSTHEIESSNPSTQPRALAELTRLDLPLMDQSIDEAWQLVDDSGLDPSIVAAWRANGLRVGFLQRVQWKAFVEGLPQAVNARVERFLVDGRQTMLLASQPLSQKIDITLPGLLGDTLQQLLSHGRLQFLIRLITTTGTMEPVIEITPQHYVPQPSLEPRTEQQKLLDGHVFDRLSLQAKLSPGTLLLIGPDLPMQSTSLPEVSEVNTADAKATDDGQESEGESETEARPTKEKKPSLILPNHLGRWLLTALRVGRPVQMVVVVAVSGEGGGTGRTRGQGR